MIDLLLKSYRLKDELRSGWGLRGVRDPESVGDHSWGTALLCMLYGPELSDEREAGGGDTGFDRDEGGHQGPASGDDSTRSSLDVDRCVRMALVHDIAEAELGDVPRRVHESDQPMSREEKERREREAFELLLSYGRPDRSSAHGGIDDLDGARLDALRALWDEYEAGRSLEARFVRDMNLIDMCLQALFYEEQGRYPRAGETDRRSHKSDESSQQRSPDAPAAGGFARLDEFFETARPRLATTVGRRLFDEVETRYRAPGGAR
jgi:putative hydrolase of HD superfamily